MSINGMTRAASALHYWERRQEVVSHNLANVDTAGFKGERVFARLIEGELTVPDTATDLRTGALRQTDAPLDLALGGQGFFVVDTPQGERLVRGGSFQLDAERRVIDANGNPVLGEGGEMVLPQGTVVVDGRGTLTVDGNEVGRLRVVTLAEGARLQHEGAGLFASDMESVDVEPDARLVRQGYLEDSNVSAVGSMVEMISIQRAYAAVQRAVTTLDGVRDTIANNLGKPV